MVLIEETFEAGSARLIDTPHDIVTTIGCRLPDLLVGLDRRHEPLAEIAGLFARQTGKARLATRTIRAVLTLPRVQRHGLNDAHGDRAAALAASCKLRGANAVYVALAETLDQPLITLDREILERSSRVIEAEAPDAWVLHESSG